jgi:hypothetical protein
MTPSGRSGNAASRHPALDSAGLHVAFETRASDLVPDHERGKSQILRAELGATRPRLRLISRNADGTAGNGDSHRPVISAVGMFVFFDTEATNFGNKLDDRNRSSDVYKWYSVSGKVSLESRNFNNHVLQTGSQRPAIGLHGNYVPFESADPLIDRAVRVDVEPEQIPSLISPEVGRPVPTFPAGVVAPLDQIYLRYVGPCARIEKQPGGLERCVLH